METKEEIQKEFTDFEEFNLKKSKEKPEDSYLSLEDTARELIKEINEKKQKEKKTSNMWWGARKTAEMSFICLLLWQILQYNQDNMKEYITRSESNNKESLKYIDEKIEIIKDSVGKVTLNDEQAVIVVSDLIKVHHITELSYFDKILKARYPQGCIKDNNQINCERKVQSDIQRRFFYLKSKLNKFSSDKGLLGDYFTENYPKQTFVNDVNAILFSNLRKNYKMDALKVLISDYETEFIRDFQISLTLKKEIK